MCPFGLAGVPGKLEAWVKWGDRDLMQPNTEKGRALLGAGTAPIPVCAGPPSWKGAWQRKP